VFAFGGVLLTTFSDVLPEEIKTIGFFTGILLVTISCLYWVIKLGLDTIILFCAIGAAVLALIALSLVAWQKYHPIKSATINSLNSARWISQPVIQWHGNDPILLTGKYARSGENIMVYLEYNNLTGGPMDGGYVVDGSRSSLARMPITKIDRFVKDQKASIPIATVEKYEGNQQILQWGDAVYDNYKMGITYANYFAKLILIDREGKEEVYPFMIISQSTESEPKVPIIVGPKLLEN